MTKHIVNGTFQRHQVVGYQQQKERNKQIALMLGWERHNHVSYFTWTKQNSKDHIFDSILQFNSDWNWLMEAVKKILSIVSESDDMETYNIIVDQMPDIESVFIAVSDFAKLYNEKKL